MFTLVVYFFRCMHESNQRGKNFYVPESVMEYNASLRLLRDRNFVLLGKIVNLPHTARLSKTKILPYAAGNLQ